MMRNLLVFLAGLMLLCSAFALFSRATWGEPIGVEALQPIPVQEKIAVQEEVRAKKFVLVDEKEAPVGTFFMYDGQVTLMLSDKDKKVRALLAVDKDGQPGFVLLDENGKIRVQIDVEGNEPRVKLLDENGETTFQAPQ